MITWTALYIDFTFDIKREMIVNIMEKKGGRVTDFKSFRSG